MGTRVEKRIDVIVVGGGNRGGLYGSYALVAQERMRVVACAEPRPARRRHFRNKFGLSDEQLFETWEDVASRPKFADAVIIATQDKMHEAPAVAFAKLGYSILLEKPMAVTEGGCTRIARACLEANAMFAVCHVLRYTYVNRKIKALIDSGAIGELQNIQHTEPVGFAHFAHSYVRGNWHNSEESSFSLLAKSCHDIDLIRYWMGGAKNRCVKVSSFGTLKHFRRDKKPDEAGDATNCLDCAFEGQCPYSAKRMYLDPIERVEGEMHKRGEKGPVPAKQAGWTRHFMPEDTVDSTSVKEALRTSNYGKCVYECDNDVCDNQVVNLEFENGSIASFTMIAFTEKLCVRTTRVFGSRGELFCDDGATVRHFDFATRSTNVYTEESEDDEDFKVDPSAPRGGGHQGADFMLMDAFVRAVATGDASHIATGARDALESHLMVFEAERSRVENRIVNLVPVWEKLEHELSHTHLMMETNPESAHDDELI